MTRVLHVIDTSAVGGGQTAVRHLLDGCRTTQVRTHLACHDGGPLIDEARALGTPVHPVAFDKRFLPDKARAVARIARDNRIDVLHAHGLLATYYCSVARAVFGARVPLVYHQHGFHHHSHGARTRRARIAAERWLAGRADAVIAVSRADHEQLLADSYVSASRLRLIHYGLPAEPPSTESLAAAREAIGPTDGLPVVGLVARLHPQKGVDTFLRAAAVARARQLRAVFAIVGVGELEGELRTLAASLGLDGHVRWVNGKVPGRAAMPHFDVGVLASRWEGLPLVLLELMAAARPIVATTVQGCLDAVGDAEAELVPPDAPEAMADAIIRLIGNPALAKARGEAACERFQRSFTLESMVQRVRTVYEEVCS